MTSSEYGGRLEEEIDDKDDEALIVGGNLCPIEEECDGWRDVFESSSQLKLLLLLFVPEVEMEKGPMGNSTSSTRTVPEALCRGEANISPFTLVSGGEGFSSAGSTSVLAAALYPGDRLQQNQL